MGDINFLSDNKEDKKEKKKEPLKKIEWTSPEKKAVTESRKEEKSSFFSLFKKGNVPDDKMQKSREAVLRTIGEKEKAETARPAVEPKDMKRIVKKPDLPKSIEKKAGHTESKAAPKIAKAAPVKKIDLIRMQIGEKIIDPRRINLLNRLIDSWRNRRKERLEKKNRVEPIPADPQKKEEKAPLKKEDARIGEKEAATDKKAKEDKKPAADDKTLVDSHILETNLIKGENVLHFIDWHKNSVTLFLFAFFAVFIVSGTYFWLVLWGKEVNIRIANAENNIAELDYNIEQAKKEVQEFSALEKKVKLLSQLLENHIYWTNFFRFLEDNTMPDVYYSGGFNGDNSGSYSLSANARSFNSISEQLKVFKINDFVESVNVKGGKASSGDKPNVSFDLQISIDPKLFTQFSN